MAPSLVVVTVGLVGVRVSHLAGEADVPFPPNPPPLEHGVGVAPTWLAPRPPETGPLITPTQAKTIVERLWPFRDAALLARDAPTIRAIERGPALEVDLTRMANGWRPDRLHGATSDERFTVYVPRQHSWPIRFMAQTVTTTSDVPFLAIVIFERLSPSTPWQVVLDTGIGGNEYYDPQVQPPILDEEGYNLIPEERFTEPVDVIHALGRYWQSWLEHGEEPRGPNSPAFGAGTWSDEYGRSRANEQDTRDPNGLLAHSTYGKPPTPPELVWTFGVRDIEVLVCGPIYQEVIWTGRAHQDKLRRKWGPALNPGTYRQVIGQGIREVCLTVPRYGEIGVLGATLWDLAPRGFR